MEVYKATYNENEQEGVFALSVVEDPAMQDFFITLKEQKDVEITLASEDKRLLLGAALIPDQKVYRNIDGHEFHMVFEKETIEKLAHNFLKNGKQNNSSLEHEVKLNGMSVVQSWTVDDPQNDKSALYGKNYPKGTWVTMMRVDNEDMWQQAKQGKIKGFSIDAFLGLQKIEFNNLNTKEMADNKSIAEQIKDGFSSVLAMFNEQKEPETPEEVTATAEETTAEEVTEPTTEVNEIEVQPEDVSKQIEEAVTQMKAHTEKLISELKETHKVELSEKDKEIESLKAELSKQPEVEAITPGKDSDVESVKPIETSPNAPASITARAASNIAQAMGW